MGRDDVSLNDTFDQLSHELRGDMQAGHLGQLQQDRSGEDGGGGSGCGCSGGGDGDGVVVSREGEENAIVFYSSHKFEEGSGDLNEVENTSTLVGCAGDAVLPSLKGENGGGGGAKRGGEARPPTPRPPYPPKTPALGEGIIQVLLRLVEEGSHTAVSKLSQVLYKQQQRHHIQETALEAVRCLRNLAFSRAGALLLVGAGGGNEKEGGEGRRGNEAGAHSCANCTNVMTLLEFVLNDFGSQVAVTRGEHDRKRTDRCTLARGGEKESARERRERETEGERETIGNNTRGFLLSLDQRQPEYGACVHFECLCLCCNLTAAAVSCVTLDNSQHTPVTAFTDALPSFCQRLASLLLRVSSHLKYILEKNLIQCLSIENVLGH